MEKVQKSKAAEQDLSCHCSGEGRITFVFDAGMGNWSLFFHPIFEDLKKLTRVCLINRKGYTSHKKPETTRDARTMAMEINENLEKLNIYDSIILVGHSLGGLTVRMYHSLFPEKVMGMVLLDAAHPQLWERIPGLKANIEEQITQINKVITLAKWGLLPLAKKKIPTFGLPKELLKDYYKITTKPLYYITYKMEMEALRESLEQCKSLGSLGNLPLLVISSPQGLNQPINADKETSTSEKNAWIDMQKELAQLSTHSTYIESKGDHFLQLSDTKTVLEQIKSFYHRISFLTPA